MLTSEQQKIYNVKVPKGGYGYYTLYHGIYDPENDIDERPSYAQTGDLFEPEGSSVVYKATRRNGKTTWAIAEDAQRQSESGEGGSGGGSSLPSMTGKNGKVLGVTLDSEDNEQAEWVTPSGGAEKFVVTLTQDTQTQDTQTETWTADKTVAEIVAADAAGKIVECKVETELGTLSVPLVQADSITIEEITSYIVLFSCFVTDFGLVVDGMTNEGTDAWELIKTPIPTSSNAPLIVTVTTQDGTTYTGDKTFAEIEEAYDANRVIWADVMGTRVSLTTIDKVNEGAVFELTAMQGSSLVHTVAIYTDIGIQIQPIVIPTTG